MIGAAALALLATVASGQGTPAPDLRVERVVARFARCAARGDPVAARALLNTERGSAAERKLLFKFMGNRQGCGKYAIWARSGWVVMRGERIRGAVARQLYLDAPGIPAARPDVAPVAAGGDGFAVVRCAVSLNPAAADSLVRAERLSLQEAAATKALAPHLNQCRNGGGTLNISGTSIHLWAAEALYQLRRDRFETAPQDAPNA